MNAHLLPHQARGRTRRCLLGLGTGGSETQAPRGREDGHSTEAKGDPSSVQPGQGLGPRQCHPYLLGLLFPEAPHLLAERVGAGLVLLLSGLPLLAVIHGSLCWEEPNCPPGPRWVVVSH